MIVSLLYFVNSYHSFLNVCSCYKVSSRAKTIIRIIIKCDESYENTCPQNVEILMSSTKCIIHVRMLIA